MSNRNNRKPKSATREWVESVLIALVLAVVIRSYFIQPFKIPSGSMRMTLIEGDHLFVDKLTYGPQVLPPMFWDIGLQEGSPLLSIRWPNALLPMTKTRLPGFSKPHRGDIIVFVYPVDPTKDFIKRLIAVGGEDVSIKDGAVYINGQEVTDPRIKRTYYYNRGDYGAEGQTVHVPPGYVFVMGDNSGSSYDSRYWGFVPESNIIGRADYYFLAVGSYPDFAMRLSVGLLFLVGIMGLSGCQSAPHQPKPSQADTVSALTTMTQGLTNKPITEAQLKNLAVQVSKDPEAQSALRSINTALSAQHTVKYCPEDGERFSADMIWCPDHKVKLEWIE